MNRLSPEYERICQAMIKDFLVEMNIEGYKDNFYSFHYPSFGEQMQSSKKILIYNRWNDVEWEPSFATSTHISDDIVNQARYFSNPLAKESLAKPIERYLDIVKSSRPFFYDVTKEISQKILELNFDDESWIDRIVFSNLLKIGKENGIDQSEYQAQIEYSKLLFLLELEEIKPDVVLLITSLDYGEDFTNAIGLEANDCIETNDFIIVQGNYKGAKVILTRCPDNGNAEKCVKQVLELIHLM